MCTDTYMSNDHLYIYIEVSMNMRNIYFFVVVLLIYNTGNGGASDNSININIHTKQCKKLYVLSNYKFNEQISSELLKPNEPYVFQITPHICSPVVFTLHNYNLQNDTAEYQRSLYCNRYGFEPIKKKRSYYLQLDTAIRSFFTPPPPPLPSMSPNKTLVIDEMCVEFSSKVGIVCHKKHKVFRQLSDSTKGNIYIPPLVLINNKSYDMHVECINSIQVYLSNHNDTNLSITSITHNKNTQNRKAYYHETSAHIHDPLMEEDDYIDDDDDDVSDERFFGKRSRSRSSAPAATIVDQFHNHVYIFNDYVIVDLTYNYDANKVIFDMEPFVHFRIIIITKSFDLTNPYNKFIIDHYNVHLIFTLMSKRMYTYQLGGTQIKNYLMHPNTNISFNLQLGANHDIIEITEYNFNSSVYRLHWNSVNPNSQLRNMADYWQHFSTRYIFNPLSNFLKSNNSNK